MGFKKWLEKFISKKGFDLEHRFEVIGDNGANSVPLGCVVEAMNSATKQEQQEIKSALVRLDFHAANCLDFFRHLSQALAI